MIATKRRFEQFSFYDDMGIERHLEKMAEKGWQLEKMTRFGWMYRRAEPQRLTYAVTYFSEASQFNPYPTENQQTFYDYCKNAGWRFVAEWSQMQIFCADRENPTPIETDESVKLQAIHRAMKKNFLPSGAVIFVLSLLQIYLQLRSILDDPVYRLASGVPLFSAAMWVIVALSTLVELTGYAVWRCRSKKSVRMGGHCAPKSRVYRAINFFLFGLLAILVVLFVTTLRYGWLGIFGMAGVFAIIALAWKIQDALKKSGASKRVNIVVTLLSIVALSVVLNIGITLAVFRGMNTGWFGRKPVETHTVTVGSRSYSWDIYRDPLPLKLEDLQQVDYDYYSYRWTETESFLLAQYTGRQDAAPGVMPELHYSIAEVKWPALFDYCLEDYLNMYNYEWRAPQENTRVFRRTDDLGWRADAVYQLYDREEAVSSYILCWGNRIVHIRFDALPTAQQIAVTVEKLGK